VRFPGFWNAAQIKIANFDLYPLPDASTVVAGLESGQYNVASIPGSVVSAAKEAGLTVQVIDSLVVAVLDVNNTIAPFDDDNVVLALKYAVDRNALLQTAQFGYGEVAYQPFPAGYVGYNASIGSPYASTWPRPSRCWPSRSTDRTRRSPSPRTRRPAFPSSCRPSSRRSDSTPPSR
jgi:ABC-type transport system substrate-binding protein